MSETTEQHSMGDARALAGTATSPSRRVADAKKPSGVMSSRLAAKPGFLSFPEALELMHDGLTMTRQAWVDAAPKGRIRQLELILPEPSSLLDNPYFIDWGYDDHRRPWAMTAEDILAVDYVQPEIAQASCS